ncbi:DUF2197 domain-containing protein [Staphylococcus massiliensis]|uniref:DUF2197 domain-containing protein n=1 Tax=Staphylococcus massiliensis S46 TaxID=1229783 RepID=K9AXB9_9STAP|nr:DUF2197 domain-containing protein [Staphylococcus massiliensis]EKU46175.1 hypothetical protein C273_09689 [Staphylococcus massiliensis S46]MCG3400496.1 YlaI family protein [Staphylococcus massiliensis]MCG3401472.1 YlaI family protein [Staphylococcus massiliensis]MCG3411744.1 YlaI family protein [Staphylococcus massiliensis]POA01281.1 DUF2197 domain-containing protein [Staphylococcus massiliensis CCUG 55927]
MYKVKCIICDTEVMIDDETLEAKRLKNNPIKTYMCPDCKHKLDRPKSKEDESK